MRIGCLLGTALLVITSGCASPSGGSTANTAASGDSKTVTEAELAGATQINLYDYVSAERPRWLHLRSPGSLNNRSSLSIVVYVNDAPLGAPETLKTISTNGVKMLRYYDASAAQQKFNGRDFGAVIQVIPK
jgi:hypothetical protein